MYLEKVVVHGYRAASKAPLECVLPGRFAVLAGPNSSGKSTVVESILMAHRDVFPYFARPTSAALSRSVASRTIDLTYAWEDNDHSPLGELCRADARMPKWTTELSASMGRISPSRTEPIAEGQLPILYLSPTRNPAADLAGRDARLIVELLRAQAFRDRDDKSLKDLRGQLAGLISSVVSKWPVADAEARVAGTLADLTDGVSGRVPYLATTAVDDTFLARMFEFLLGTSGGDRIDAHRLETEGLGYSNLLQLAVVLASIPDLTHQLPKDEAQDGGTDELDTDSGSDAGADPAGLTAPDDDQRSDTERAAAMEEALQRRRMEEDTFFAGSFHAVVVLEEPEAHLHPQLQHGLVQYLKEVVERRPEVQVVITTHSDEIVSGCDPEDLVLFRRGEAEQPVARTVQTFSLSQTKLARARRHLDVNRSASLFADRVVLVEGVTDAMVLRALARVWAGSDRVRRRFVDALTITVLGSRVGPWLPELLTKPGMEISSKVAVLGDSDDRPLPTWAEQRRSGCFEMFLNEPTLEPALVDQNESIIENVFEQMGIKELPWTEGSEPTPEGVRKWFAHKGKRHKAAFADLFSQAIFEDPTAVTVPEHMNRLLDFIWEGFRLGVPEDEEAELGGDDTLQTDAGDVNGDSGSGSELEEGSP